MEEQKAGAVFYFKQFTNIIIMTLCYFEKTTLRTMKVPKLILSELSVSVWPSQNLAFVFSVA